MKWTPYRFRAIFAASALLLAGCLIPGAPLSPIPEFPLAERIVVHDANELVAAIGSDRALLLEPNLYQLDEPLRAAAEAGHPHLRYDADYDMTILHGLKNFRIIGAGPGSTRLVLDSSFAHVLAFENSEKITIRGVELSHRPPSKKICLGAALGFKNVRNIEIENTVLKGSGTFGLWLEGVDGLEMERSVITECTRGIVWAQNSRDLNLVDSIFVNNAGGFNFDATGPVRIHASKIKFNDALAAEDYTNYLFALKKSKLTVESTQIARNRARGFIDSDRKKVRLEDAALDDNVWVKE